MDKRINQISEITNSVLKDLNKLNFSGDYLNSFQRVNTFLENVSNNENGTYTIGLRTYDLKIGVPDDNDSLLESNLSVAFKKL